MEEQQKTVTKIEPEGFSQQEGQFKIRVAAYCRVSSDSMDQENSFAAQVKYFTDMLNKNKDFQIVDIYADDVVSGRSTTKRDDFNRLIEDCKKGRVDRIITKSVSRFARNTVDCLNAIRLLSGLGVSVYFEKENIDTAKMSSEVILAMSGVQAQSESTSHGKNMQWSYEHRMKDGDFIGCNATYGYSLINSSAAVINEKEAKVVRLIYNKYLSGMGTQKIAKYLNDSGIMTKYDNEWNALAVRYILKNERYIGDALLQKTTVKNEYEPQKMLNKGTKNQYYVENCIPVIITKEQRIAVLKLMESRRKQLKNRGGHLLSKMLRCSDCGHLYRRIDNPEGALWRCTYRNGGLSECIMYTLREDDVCEAFINAVNKMKDGRTDILLPLIQRLEALQSMVNGTESKLHSIDKEIATVSKQILVISELLSNGILDSADFVGQNNALSDKLSKLRLKRKKCLQRDKDDDSLNKLRELSEILDNMECDLSEYDEELIRTVIKQAVVVSETELQIEFIGGLKVTEHLPKYYSTRSRRT